MLQKLTICSTIWIGSCATSAPLTGKPHPVTFEIIQMGFGNENKACLGVSDMRKLMEERRKCYGK